MGPAIDSGIRNGLGNRTHPWVSTHVRPRLAIFAGRARKLAQRVFDDLGLFIHAVDRRMAGVAGPRRGREARAFSRPPKIF